MSNYSPLVKLRAKLTSLGHRFDIACWSNASRAMVGRLSVLQVGSHPVLTPGEPFKSHAPQSGMPCCSVPNACGESWSGV